MSPGFENTEGEGGGVVKTGSGMNSASSVYTIRGEAKKRVGGEKGLTLLRKQLRKSGVTVSERAVAGRCKVKKRGRREIFGGGGGVLCPKIVAQATSKGAG